MKKLLTLFAVLALVGFGCAPQSEDPSSVEEHQKTETEVEADADVNIVLNTPEDESVVTSPLVVTGEARVFENVLNWQLFDGRGQFLDEGIFLVDAPDVGEYGPFEGRVFIPEVETEDVIFKVFQYSARDGSLRDLESVVLTLADSESSTVDVFFIDALAEEASACEDNVVALPLAAHKTVNIAELALHLLLDGPEDEAYSTEVPEGTGLNSISILDGVAKVDFTSSDISAWSGGSCHVAALREQIEQTLLQFDTVTSVEITVNGSRDILEP